MTYASHAQAFAVVFTLTVLEEESCITITFVPFLKQHPLHSWYDGLQASIKLDLRTTPPSPLSRSLGNSPTHMPTVTFPRTGPSLCLHAYSGP